MTNLRTDKSRRIRLPGRIIGAAISPNEGRVLLLPYNQQRGSRAPLAGYYLVDLETGRVEHILRGRASGTVKWFPDSKRFIARTGKKRTDLGIVDIDRPNEIKVFLRDVNQWDVWFPPAKTR